MGTVASQITSLTIVYSTVYSDADQRKHQSSASLAFVRGIHRGPVNSPHKWPVTRKMFPFDDVIMNLDVFNHIAVHQIDAKITASDDVCLSELTICNVKSVPLQQPMLNFTSIDYITHGSDEWRGDSASKNFNTISSLFDWIQLNNLSVPTDMWMRTQRMSFLLSALISITILYQSSNWMETFHIILPQIVPNSSIRNCAHIAIAKLLLHVQNNDNGDCQWPLLHALR